MLKKLRCSLFVLLSGLASCTPSPPDVPVCEGLTKRLTTDPTTGHVILSPSPTCEIEIDEPECGHCVYIVSGKQIFIGENAKHQLGGKPWSLVKAESIMLPAVESYAPLSAYIINACKKAGCSADASKFQKVLSPLKPK